MIFSHPLPEASASRAAVRAAARMDEDACVAERLALARLPEETRRRIEQRAGSLVQRVREERVATGGIDAFLQEYELSSKEGVTLMCLAEALLRVPDAETADRLIRDKIGGADWEGHMGRAESWFVNASTWALMLTGRVLELNRPGREWRDVLGTLISRSGEPVIRQALTQAMRIMGRQFVMARNIESALERAERDEARGYRHSYDMLGEAARTMADARRYMDSYAHAIEAVGRAAAGRGPIESPGISVKLSALHPRYEFAQGDRAMAELLPRIQELARLAKSHDIGLTIDAEEADRLDLSLDVIAAVAEDPALSGWNGFGLAVQAYQKRALPLIDWLAELATAASRRLMVRLVKGAYWDTEIKLSQVEGLADYPVFTRKANTDVSYLACMQRMLEHRAQIYPAFATHNAHTVAAALELAGNRRDFEFQRLHGMGEPLYDGIAGQAGEGVPCRVYAPVGGHGDLLAYLVRRLLENGANTSFVHRIADEDLPVARVVADPVAAVERLQPRRNPHIPLPRALYGERRLNARGVDLADPVALAELAEQMEAALLSRHYAGPLIGGRQRNGTASERYDPADRRRIAGLVADATPEQAGEALAIAAGAFPAWEMTPAAERAAMLRRAAELYEQHMPELMGLAVREAGKTVRDAVAEVREAVDFLRYYAMRAEDEFAGPLPLPGPTGEENRMMLRGRGAFLCISPWNFPLAIFTGQLSAALAAGNTVLAKPAEQTPLIAHRAVQLLHEAGVPGEVLQLLPGEGAAVAGPLLEDERIAGVAFTGSVETAHVINRALAARRGAIAPLIAETGGLNAMIVDSTALPEQVARDVLISAFQSAGQRCSALRVLFVQRDAADRLLTMVAGAMDELAIGDPALLSTDIGPVIDEEARAMLEEHAGRMAREGKVIRELALPKDCAHGSFFAPRAYEVDGVGRIGGEKFGPILHVVRYAADRLDDVIAAINGTGFGLTLGIHSRIDSTARYIAERVRAGNIYVNRNQIGAVVGVQPFGGEGLSGTGPKAGGPHYLTRFAVERVVSTDTAAVGGNAALLAEGSDDEG